MSKIGTRHTDLRRWGTLLLALVLLLQGAWNAGWAASARTATQRLADIEQVVRSYVLASEAAMDGEREVRVGALDPRLRLQACSAPLEAFSVSRATRGNALTVGVRCTAPQPWTIYVSARVIYRGPVVVAARALARGTVLTEHDLRVARKDVSAAPAGVLTDPGQAVGRRLRRPVAAGATLTSALLETVPVIERGQRVDLVAGSGALMVRMTGRALMDGAAGQRIRVRNVKSRKVVEGTVDPAGFVRVD